MAVTFRQMMNRVLNNLGESEIASSTAAISDTYLLLLRNILNQVKEEVEDAHNWRALRVRVTATVAANGEPSGGGCRRSRGWLAGSLRELLSRVASQS